MANWEFNELKMNTAYLACIHFMNAFIEKIILVQSSTLQWQSAHQTLAKPLAFQI